MNHPVHSLQLPRRWQYWLAFCLLWAVATVQQSAFAQPVADAANCPACAQIKARLDEAQHRREVIARELRQAFQRREALEVQLTGEGPGSLATELRGRLVRTTELIDNLRATDRGLWGEISGLDQQWRDCVTKNCPKLTTGPVPPPLQPTCRQCQAHATELHDAEGEIFFLRLAIARRQASIDNDFLPKVMAQTMSGDDQRRLTEARARLDELTSDLEFELDRATLARAELAACSRRYCVNAPAQRDSQAVCPACQPILDQINRLATDLVAAKEHWSAMRRELRIYDDIEFAKRTAEQQADVGQIVRELEAISDRICRLKNVSWR